MSRHYSRNGTTPAGNGVAAAAPPAGPWTLGSAGGPLCESCQHKLLGPPPSAVLEDSTSGDEGGSVVKTVGRCITTRISFAQLVRIKVYFSGITLFFVIVTAMYMWNDVINEAWCHIPGYVPENMIPTISAVTSVEPQRYYWRFSVAIFYFPVTSLLNVAWWKDLYRRRERVTRRWRSLYLGWLLVLAVVMCFLEVGYLTAAFVMNREIFSWHAKGTWTYCISSPLYHSILTALYWASGARPRYNKSFRRKLWITVLYDLTMIFMLFDFKVFHQRYCWPYAHSVFSLCEYFMSFLALTFEHTGTWDFREKYILSGVFRWAGGGQSEKATAPEAAQLTKNNFLDNNNTIQGPLDKGNSFYAMAIEIDSADKTL